MHLPLVLLLSLYLVAAKKPVIKTNSQMFSLMEKFEHRNMSSVQAKLAKLREINLAKLESQTIAKQSVMTPTNEPVEKMDRIRAKGDSLFEVNQNLNLQNIVSEGDIMLTEAQIDQKISDATATRGKRQAYRNAYSVWPGKTVYYQYHASATNAIKAVFNAAIAIWRSNSCINFVLSGTAANRILIIKGQGCWSYVGRIGGVQSLSLGDGCESVGTAAHELGHALGYFHEQSRYDRDSHITVQYPNIQTGWADQFDKETAATNNNYGLVYDYGGIMHYGGTSASGNGQATMVAKIANYQQTMGSDIVSFYDISMMNAHYKCKAQCPLATSAKCQNGGFPHPRACKRCICPSGYGGTLCAARTPTTCGKIVEAGATYKILRSVVGAGTATMKTHFAMCNYWIRAPIGKRVEVIIKSYSGPVSTGCAYGGMEIKTQPDQKRTGYRFCTAGSAGKKFYSSSRIVPIITFNRYSKSIVELHYRIKQ